MAKTCSICGKGLRFGAKCYQCRTRLVSESRPESRPEPPPAPVEERSPLRFAVTRLDESKMVFGVLDTLTDTLREVTSDPLDAADVCGQLNSEFVYAMGRRWPRRS